MGSAETTRLLLAEERPEPAGSGEGLCQPPTPWAEDPLALTFHAAIAEETRSQLRHALKNRLGGIRNAAFYLKKRAQGSELAASDPRVPKFLTLIDQEVEALSALMDQEPDLDVAPAAKTSAARCAALALRSLGSRAVPVLTECVDVEWVALEARVALALRCLLENAIEAAPAGTHVSVRASFADGRVVFDVCDAGPGVSSERIAAVFAHFVSSKPGHLGLGLNIARRVASIHGGDLRLEHDPAGTHAILSLPIDARQEGS
ncbi:MAG: ATP-binding protein [Polyangiaceae bacterium]